MPEETGGDKTLPASPQKIQRAREEGNLAKSQDLNSGLALLAALIAMRLLGPYIFDHLVEAGRYYFASAHALTGDVALLQPIAVGVIARLAACVLPFMLIMLGVGVLANLMQVGVLFTSKPLQPKLDRLNPISGFQKFVSPRSFVELTKSLLKLTCVGYIVYLTLQSRSRELVMLMELTPRLLVPAVGGLVLAIWWRIALFMLVLGILDYGYQYWQHRRDLRMTRREAQDEAKQLEGDPRVKQRVRQIQRQMAMQRMMGEVPEADVVITNPTTYAVALRYDPVQMGAPRVVAKGARHIAQRIRELALEHRVPIVEKPELARAIYRTVELNRPVPEQLFMAVAQILAYVYQIDRREAKIREREAQWAAANG